MDGKWTDIWDDERRKWIKVYIRDTPLPSKNGTALYGPNGDRIDKPIEKPVGFRLR